MKFHFLSATDDAETEDELSGAASR